MGTTRLWNPDEAKRANGLAEPVDRAPAVRDGLGWTAPDYTRRAVIPSDSRRPYDDDPDDPRLHPENFPSERAWAHYFAGWRDTARALRADRAVCEGKCVAFGAVAGVYSVEQILRQVYGRNGR